MRFFIVSQHFYPDTFRINDIAVALVRQGHTVRVLTSLPDYDNKKLHAKYRFFRGRRETWEGVDIHRVPTTLRRQGAFWRMINYASFAVSGWLWASFARADAEVVLTFQTSPVSMAIPAARIAKRSKCPHILYCLDLWPESVTVWDVKQNSFLYNMIHSISRAIYRAADAIAISSEPFAQYLMDMHDIDPARIVYLPQPCEQLFDQGACAYEDNGVTDFLFAGNLGGAQDIGTILDAAELLRRKGGLHIHIVGDGSEGDALRAACEQRGLSTLVTFYGRKPLQEMPAFYRMADAFLLTLEGDSFVGQTLPGKLQSYLSAGKPVVAAVPKDGAVWTILTTSESGYCAPASDAVTLAGYMAQIVDRPDEARARGRRGYELFLREFRMEAFLSRLDETIAVAQTQYTQRRSSHV